MATKLKFYDLGKKKSFATDKYAMKTRGKMQFAVAKGPSGRESWRVLGKK